MASAGAVKKRRIMIITDESLIEQIEQQAPSEIVQSIILESLDDQPTLASTLASSFFKAPTADLPPTTASSKLSPRLCVVCGAVALGYSFDAWTCESCQAFFRRNALNKSVSVQKRRTTLSSDNT